MSLRSKIEYGLIAAGIASALTFGYFSNKYHKLEKVMLPETQRSYEIERELNRSITNFDSKSIADRIESEYELLALSESKEVVNQINQFGDVSQKKKASFISIGGSLIIAALGYASRKTRKAIEKQNDEFRAFSERYKMQLKPLEPNLTVPDFEVKDSEE